MSMLSVQTEGLRDAADTIDELRCRCQDAQTENGELRDRLVSYGVCNGGIVALFAEGIERGDAENAELRAENSKLRELVAGIGNLLFSLDVDYCAACPRDGINHPCPVYTVGGGECLYKTDLRELGVGVNE